MREVILHFDIGGNDPALVEAVLREGLGARWMRFDPTEIYGEVLPPGPLEQLIMQRPELQAITSSCVRAPLPQIPGVAIVPVVLLRNPMTRVAALYASRERDATFAQFVEYGLSQGTPCAIADLQTATLAGPGDSQDAYDRALEFVRDAPAIGIVERFAESARAFAAALGPVFAQLPWRDSEPNLVPAAELPTIRAELGDELYSWLVASNQSDLRLHRSAVLRLNQVAGAPL